MSPNPLRAKSPDPRQSPFRVKSPERPLSSARVSSPGPVLNGDAKQLADKPADTMLRKGGSEKSLNADNEAGGTKKKVVKVVRKMVRKVIPQEDAGSKSDQARGHSLDSTNEEKRQTPVPPATQKTGAKKEGTQKDDLSVGLTSLMSRGRTKEHKQRFKLPEKKVEPAGEKVPPPTSPVEKTPEMPTSPVPVEEKTINESHQATKTVTDLSIKAPQKSTEGLASEVFLCVQCDYICACATEPPHRPSWTINHACI